MSEPLYPNESADYRAARDALLAEEKALVEKVKAVAQQLSRINDTQVAAWQKAERGHVCSEKVIAGPSSVAFRKICRRYEVGNFDSIDTVAYALNGIADFV